MCVLNLYMYQSFTLAVGAKLSPVWQSICVLTILHVYLYTCTLYHCTPVSLYTCITVHLYHCETVQCVPVHCITVYLYNVYLCTVYL